MSNQKPLKIVNLEHLKTKTEPKPEEVARVYKDKNHEVKQSLAFKTNANKTKLA